MTYDKNTPDDAEVKNPKTTRIRKNIYGKRLVVSLRLAPSLRDRMMGVCDRLNISANAYVTKLIEADLKARNK